MIDWPKASYKVLTRNGSDRATWDGMLRAVGCKVDDAQFDPTYSDVMPKKPVGGSITLDLLPKLAAVLNGLRVGQTLVIPDFGHLCSEQVWKAVADRLQAKGSLLECAKTRQVFDGSDLARGNTLNKQERGRRLTPARLKSKVKSGRTKHVLVGQKLERAIALFPDPDWPVPRIAAEVGLERMTFLRRMEEATGTMSKDKARELLLEGNWPPRRKLR